MVVRAGSQLFQGMKPILLLRALWTTSRFPQFMSQRCDVLMCEGTDAVSSHRQLSMLMSNLGMLQGLPGLLVSGQVILFARLLRGAAMGVRRDVVQFGGPLMVLVVGSVMVTC